MLSAYFDPFTNNSLHWLHCANGAQWRNPPLAWAQ